MPRRREKLPQNEWTHALDLEDVPEGGLKLTLISPQESKEALERRLDISALESLSADLSVTPQAGGIYYVSGLMTAEIVQECVVTTDPIESRIEEQVEGWFIDREAGVTSFAKAQKDRAAESSKGNVEVEMSDEAEDPETAIGGQIDLGEFLVQNLSLAINPYPHKEGAHYDYTDDVSSKSGALEGRKSPFEALKDWKEKR